ILVMPLKKSEQVQGGIIIPVVVNKGLEEGIAVTVSPDVIHVNDGDKILYPTGAGISMTIDGTDYKFINGPVIDSPGDVIGILCKFPSRMRVQRFFETLDNMHSMIADKENFHIVCTLDLDDTTMNTEEIKAKIAMYPNTSAMWGYSKTKIDAFNRDMTDIDG